MKLTLILIIGAAFAWLLFVMIRCYIKMRRMSKAHKSFMNDWIPSDFGYYRHKTSGKAIVIWQDSYYRVVGDDRLLGKKYSSMLDAIIAAEGI